MSGNKGVENKRPLRGIVPPMITPLSDRDRLDVPGLERLIEHMLGGGVHALFILGTTGEASGLSPTLQREMVDRTCRQVAGRAPVLVGVTNTDFDAAVSLARHAAGAGASAVVASTPYYLCPEQEELVSYITAIAEEQSLPVYLYNIPVLTKTAFDVPTVVRLAEIEKVVGMKDSSGDAGYLRQLQQRIARKDFSFFTGVEQMLAEAVAHGAHGCVGGGANIDPRLFVQQYDAAVAGDSEAVKSLQARIVQLDRIYRLGMGIGSIIRGTKAALNLMGVCSDRMAFPFRSCSETERQTIRQYLAEMGLLKPQVEVAIHERLHREQLQRAGG